MPVVILYRYPWFLVLNGSRFGCSWRSFLGGGAFGWCRRHVLFSLSGDAGLISYWEEPYKFTYVRTAWQWNSICNNSELVGAKVASN
jgi:hypothetical protein